LDDLRDFWWMSCRMARLQYGAKNIPEKLPPPRVWCTHVTDDRQTTDGFANFAMPLAKRNVVTFG